MLHPNIKELVLLITSSGIRSNAEKKEKWAQFKRDNADMLTMLLQLQDKGVENPGALIGIDFDEERKLMLLNYTGQAHNFLHEVERGWTHVLRQLRGLIVSYDGEPKMVSRGFEKFFNYGELPECTIETMSESFGADIPYLAREKADGHMIEYFVHEGELCASTRGKFGTASSDLALGMFTLEDFNRVQELTPDRKLMSVVVELVHPDTRVHVDYDKSHLFLLAAFDTHGDRFTQRELDVLCAKMKFTAPVSKLMSLNDMIAEINDRSVTNREGWVMSFDGYLVKFKYIAYIGEMVKSKLSYKYIMNCIKNDRLDKMLFTLPEEVREHAYHMVDEIKEVTKKCIESNTYKPLYSFYNDNEGGEAYFKTVCRTYWREHVCLSNDYKNFRTAPLFAYSA
tara:strand:- start:612 stop:1802 length:1191 start_codon:yes stop_codon:yes gene_type:complete